MKNSRLFEILYLLVERRALTAGELAQALEAATAAGQVIHVQIIKAGYVPTTTASGGGNG